MELVRIARSNVAFGSSAAPRHTISSRSAFGPIGLPPVRQTPLRCNLRLVQTKLNELVQLNQWGPYSYSRDELVGLLDAALSGDAAAE